MTPEPTPPPDREGRSPPATWRAWEAVPLFVMVYLIAGLVTLALLGQNASCRAEFIVPLLVGETCYAGFVILWVRTVNRGPLAALGSSRRPWRDVGVGILGGGAILIGSALFSVLVFFVAEQVLGREPPAPEQVDACVRGFSLLLGAPVVVLAPPIGEELFFRGFLYKGLRRTMPVWSSVLISSVAFALVHYAPNPTPTAGVLLTIAIFPVGVGLALVYEHRHSLVASMTAHAVFNLVGFIAIASGR